MIIILVGLVVFPVKLLILPLVQVADVVVLTFQQVGVFQTHGVDTDVGALVGDTDVYKRQGHIGQGLYVVDVGGLLVIALLGGEGGLQTCLLYTSGTKVKEVVKTMEKSYVSGIAKDKDVARLALVRLQDRPGIAFKIFSLLGKEGINVDLILQSIGRDDTKDISFTVAKGDALSLIHI